MEYGTSTSYGTTVPVPEGDVGLGMSPVLVSQAIGGLEPNRTYHWRVVAGNSAGPPTVAADHTFIFDTSGGGLPDGRAYEMVTPPAKNGVLVHNQAGLPILPPDIAESGQRVIAMAIGCFAGTESCNANHGNAGSPYAFTRTPAGWVTTPLELPARQIAISEPRR